MKKNVKLVLIILGLIIAVVGLILYKNSPVAVRTLPVNPKTAELSFTEQGIVLAQRYLDVFSTVSGEIKSIYVIEGQHINEGDLICKIDDSSFQFELRQMEGSIRNCELEINNLLAETQRQKEHIENMKTLYDSGFISKYDFEDAVQTGENMETGFETKRQQLKNMQLNVEQLRKKLNETAIVSPICGTVTALNIKDTNIAGTQAPIATIAGGKDCVIEVYVSVRDIEAVRPGNKVDLVLEGRRANQKISGTVLFVENQAVVKVSALGTEERKVKVNVVPNEQDILKDGYEVDVNFYYYQEENKLTVPKAALFRENDLDMVWVVFDGKAQKTQVQKGMELRTEFVIEGGLGKNSIVIADANVSGLKEGVRIRHTNT